MCHRRPVQSIVSGKIARLVLIQLQFVKKELLVAMQAIDDLFNANQVNLQLLAITPAVLSIISLNIISKTLFAVCRAILRGKTVSSSAVIQRDLREGVRSVERVLLLNDKTNSGSNLLDPTVAAISDGRVLSGLYRVQNILSVNSNFFERRQLLQMQVLTYF